MTGRLMRSGASPFARAGETPNEDLIAIENHLLWCAGCRTLLKSSETMAKLFGRWSEINHELVNRTSRPSVPRAAVFEDVRTEADGADPQRHRAIRPRSNGSGTTTVGIDATSTASRSLGSETLHRELCVSLLTTWWGRKLFRRVVV